MVSPAPTEWPWYAKGERKDTTASERRDLAWPLVLTVTGWPWADHSLYREVGGPGCSFRSCQPLEVFSAKSDWRRMFPRTNQPEKMPHSWHSVWGSGEQVTIEVHLDVGVHFVLISDALNIKPGFEQTAVSLCGILCPFETESFSKWMLPSREETREGEQSVTRVRRVDYAALSLAIFRYGLYALRGFFIYIRSRLILEWSFAGSVWILMGWANFAHISWRFCPQGMG